MNFFIQKMSQWSLLVPQLTYLITAFFFFFLSLKPREPKLQCNALLIWLPQRDGKNLCTEREAEIFNLQVKSNMYFYTRSQGSKYLPEFREHCKKIKMLQVCQSILFLESSGSPFTALVSSAKFDFKLPEVKEGLYSINTRSSHTFLQLLHSLLSKITILSSTGKLWFSFTGRDGQRMSSSRRPAFCSASPLPPASFQRRCNPGFQQPRTS